MRDDAAEVTAWIREFTPRLYGVALAFAHDADDAEDLLQELWLRAYRRASQRSSTMPPGAWLHAILISIGRSRWRRRRRRQLLLALWHRSDSERTVGATPDIARELRHAQLWRAIAVLPSLQRTILLLRIVDDLATSEVAAQLGLAEGTVKSSLHRALRSLRGEMTDAHPLHPFLASPSDG